MSGPRGDPRPCPVCGSRSSELLYEQRFERFDRGSPGDGYDVVACADCGMCFASGPPTEERLAQYYADSSKYDLSADGAELTDRDRRRYADQAEFVAAHIAERDLPILDVGTATGGFLDALRRAGFSRPFGVDPSPDAVRFARDELDLDVVVGGLGEAGGWGHEFDVVSYVAVLEHVLDPGGQVRAASELLREGGHFFLSVPDAGSFAKYIHAPFQEFSVEHINYFTPRSLANLMGLQGYGLVAERTILLPWGSDAQGPALEAVYRWDGISRPWVPDRSGAEAVHDYVVRSQAEEDRVRKRISDLAASGERIYVWGTGTHTLHLLQSSRLGDCRIDAFLDSNPHYSGATLAGRPVLAPTHLRSADAPILVSSAVSQSAIAVAARERFGADVSLILLYGDDG